MDQFVIPYFGLAIGNHLFNLEVKDQFFEKYEFSEIRKASLKVRLDLDRQENMLILGFHISGTLEITCDRCSELFDYPVEKDEHLIVKLGSGNFEEADDVIVIDRSVHQIDLSPMIYDYICLLLPIRKLHPDNPDGTSSCNPETLKILEELKPKMHPDDPRWDLLKQIKLDNNN